MIALCNCLKNINHKILFLMPNNFLKLEMQNFLLDKKIKCCNLAVKGSGEKPISKEPLNLGNCIYNGMKIQISNVLTKEKKKLIVNPNEYKAQSDVI